MYFSLVTITTLGYGDLAPAGDVGARPRRAPPFSARSTWCSSSPGRSPLYTALGPVIGHSSRDSRNADREPEREVFGDDNGSVVDE
jgi:hypothetical protein